MAGRNGKIPTKEFISILLDNNGSYIHTARDIQARYNVSMSKQAVRERAENHSELWKQAFDPELVNKARAVLDKRLDSKNERISLDAAKFVLVYKDGWSENQKVEVKRDEPLFVVRADQTPEHLARVARQEAKIKKGFNSN